MSKQALCREAFRKPAEYACSQIFVTAEAYPQLKADSNFVALERTLIVVG